MKLGSIELEDLTINPAIWSYIIGLTDCNLSDLLKIATEYTDPSF